MARGPPRRGAGLNKDPGPGGGGGGGGSLRFPGAAAFAGRAAPGSRELLLEDFGAAEEVARRGSTSKPGSAFVLSWNRD